MDGYQLGDGDENGKSLHYSEDLLRDTYLVYGDILYKSSLSL